MNEGAPKPANKSERVKLRGDIQPVSVEMVNIDEENPELESIQERIDEDTETTHWVDFEGGDLEKLAEEGFKQDGRGSYLISPIESRDWFSDHYFNCTAVIGIGKDSKTGQEISFLSHQDPNYFIEGDEAQKENFKKALSETLKELKDRSEDESIEIVLAGGNLNPDLKEENYKQEHYAESIKFVSQIVRDTLGFDPTVLAGPNKNGETVIIVETGNRKVWINRPEQAEEFNQSYQANKIEEMEKLWPKE